MSKIKPMSKESIELSNQVSQLSYNERLGVLHFLIGFMNQDERFLLGLRKGIELQINTRPKEVEKK